jgi:hypothetical protein
MKTSAKIEEEVFSGGVRLWRPLTGRPEGADALTRLDWSLSRPAFDRSGRAGRLIDLPASSLATGPEMNKIAWLESSPVEATDARASRATEWGESGIEIDGGTYCPANKDAAARWEYSPGLGRRRGQVLLARRGSPAPAAFHDYLLRLNRNLRFVGVGFVGDAVFLQVVVQGDDRAWLGLARDALVHVYGVLRSQVAWWCQPRELIEDLFRQAALGNREDV